MQYETGLWPKFNITVLRNTNTSVKGQMLMDYGFSLRQKHGKEERKET